MLRRYLLPTLAVVALIVFYVGLFTISPRRYPPAETMRVELPSLSIGRLSSETGDVALSPDGHRIAYVVVDSLGTRRLWVQRLDEIDGRPIAETETAERPFWSPDSRMIAFFSRGRRSTLKKVRADGGTPVIICETMAARGGAWGSKDVIVFASAAEGSLSRVSAMGGEVTPATELDLEHGETSHRFPSFLPDGEKFVYASLPNSVDGYGINLGSLGSLPPKRLGSAFSAATYADPGYLLFDRGNKLVAQRLDMERLELVGEAIPIGTAPPGSQEDASRIVSASRTGTLAMLRREPRVAHLEWFGLDGTRTRLPLASAHYNEVSLSPDGRSAALSVRTNRFTMELIRYDLERDSVTRLTVDQSFNNMSVWSPDGNVIAHTSTRSGREEIYLQSANGAGEARLIPTTDAQFKSPNAWSHDGRHVVFTQMTSDNFDVYLKDVTTEAPPTPLVTGSGYQGLGYISPDSRWLVYASDEDVSEQFRLYLVSFPDGQHKTRISDMPMLAFRWSPRKNTIFFIGWNEDLHAVDVAGDDKPIPGPPRLLAYLPFRVIPGFRMFDISPDGERLLVIAAEPVRKPPAINLIGNWPGVLGNP